jgi:hypothetical protein
MRSCVSLASITKTLEKWKWLKNYSRLLGIVIILNDFWAKNGFIYRINDTSILIVLGMDHEQSMHT